MILLNPGPVNVSPGVRQALSGPDICHREDEYFDLQDSIRNSLLDLFAASGSGYSAVLLTGSGTAAVEAMIVSCVPPEGRLLVIQNGVYGERMAAMARCCGIDLGLVEGPWTQRPDIEGLRRRLGSRRYDCLAIVHHETTTGLMNDLAPVAELCQELEVRLLVDAVSSLAGEPFDLAQLRPDAVACTANKCIQGLPGMSFVLVRGELMRSISRYPPRSLYLHLPRYHQEQERRSTPFTPCVQVAYAFRAALEELRQETPQGRIQRYRQASGLMRRGLQRMGLELLLPPELRSSMLTSVLLPPGLSYRGLHDALKEQGFVIYAGQGRLAAELFRVATMGHVELGEYERFLEVLGEKLRREGRRKG